DTAEYFRDTVSADTRRAHQRPMLRRRSLRRRLARSGSPGCNNVLGKSWEQKFHRAGTSIHRRAKPFGSFSRKISCPRLDVSMVQLSAHCKRHAAGRLRRRQRTMWQRQARQQRAELRKHPTPGSSPMLEAALKVRMRPEEEETLAGARPTNLAEPASWSGAG